MKRVVNVKTQDEWDYATRKLGCTWESGLLWQIYKEDTYINLQDATYGAFCSGFFKNGYELLTFDQFKSEFFSKEDLEDGMVVKLREGTFYLKLKDIFTTVDGYIEADRYEDNLVINHANLRCLDIIAVYETNGKYMENLLKPENLSLIWKREEKSQEQLKYEVLLNNIKDTQDKLDGLVKEAEIYYEEYVK